MEEIKELRDPLTNETFIPRRITQRFACRQNQIKYNNLMAKRKRQKKAAFDKPLDKNRSILKELLGEEKEVKISKDFLLGKGYDFRFFIYQLSIDKEKGKIAAGLYEFIIYEVSKDIYKIKRNGKNAGN